MSAPARNAADVIAAALFIAWTARIALDPLLLPIGADPALKLMIDAATKVAIFVALPLLLIRRIEGGWAAGRIGVRRRVALAWAIALAWPLALIAIERGLIGRAPPLWPGTPGFGLMVAVSALLITAATEEFAFRRVLLARIAAIGGPALAIGATALLFALIHWPGWILLSGLDMASLVIPTAQLLTFGLVLGLVAWLAGDIRPAIALHVLNNLVAGALA